MPWNYHRYILWRCLFDVTTKSCCLRKLQSLLKKNHKLFFLFEKKMCVFSSSNHKNRYVNVCSMMLSVVGLGIVGTYKARFERYGQGFSFFFISSQIFCRSFILFQSFIAQWSFQKNQFGNYFWIPDPSLKKSVFIYTWHDHLHLY